jgi:preprotein translocase subunit SecE
VNGGYAIALVRGWLGNNVVGHAKLRASPCSPCHSGGIAVIDRSIPTLVANRAIRDLVPGGDEPYLKAGYRHIHASAPNWAKDERKMADAQKTPEKKRKTSIPEFVNQVRTETSKVVWPTRDETIRTAIFVFIFMVILSLFFFGIDSLFNAVVNFLLTLA